MNTEHLHAYHAQEKLVRTMEVELSEARDRLRALESVLGGQTGNPVVERDIQGQYAGIYTPEEFDHARLLARKEAKRAKEATEKAQREAEYAVEAHKGHLPPHTTIHEPAPHPADIAPSTIDEGKRSAVKSETPPPIQPTAVKHVDLPASDPVKQQQGEMLKKGQESDEAFKKADPPKSHETKDPKEAEKPKTRTSGGGH